jgi:hypothetical protein
VSIHRAPGGSRWSRLALPYAGGRLSWAAAAVVLVALAIYLRTMLPSVGFWDTGEAQTAPPTLSIMHPTGFPTYTMLGWLWSQLPIGGVAWRMNLLSGVCLALSAGLVVLIAGHLIEERHPTVRAAAAAIAGLSFAFADEAWVLGTRADVHALNTLFEAFIIWLLLCWRAAEHGGSRRPGAWLLVAALVFGIGLGNHPLLGLSAVGIAAWLFIVDPRIWRRWRLVAGAGGLLALGVLGTYAYIPIRALTPPNPPLFYAHPTTLGRLQYLVFAEQFTGLFSGFGNLLASLGSKWAGATAILGPQLGGPGWLIAAAGAATLGVRRLGTLVFMALVAVGDVVYSMNFSDGDIARYYLPTLVVATPILGVGVAMVAAAAARAAAEVSRHWAATRGRRVAATMVGALVLLGAASLPAISLLGRYDLRDLSRTTTADRWVSAVYGDLPPNAVLISWWSYSTPLWYHRWVLGERPDVLILDDRNILDDGYGTITRAVRTFLGSRPVFVVPTDWDRAQLTGEFATDSVPTYGGFADLLHILGPKELIP